MAVAIDRTPHGRPMAPQRCTETTTAAEVTGEPCAPDALPQPGQLVKN